MAREVFRRKPEDDPGEVFYTITAGDVGSRVSIETEVGTIYLVNVLGMVLPSDVGKRLYRHRRDDSTTWYWDAESDQQMARRLKS